MSGCKTALILVGRDTEEAIDVVVEKCRVYRLSLEYGDNEDWGFSIGSFD